MGNTRKHTERCSECKNSLIDLFRKIYGEIKIDHKIEIPARIDLYKNSKHYRKLKLIYDTLRKYRKNNNFVRINTLHRCDLYIPGHGFVVEFDESQHFTAAREKSLEKYPADLKLGFNKKKWIQLCYKIDAKDNDPRFRDEQRAWYDTLRDFLPLIKGFKPTIRIYMKDIRFCDLSSSKRKDIIKFKRYLRSLK